MRNEFNTIIKPYILDMLKTIVSSEGKEDFINKYRYDVERMEIPARIPLHI
jgi:hypothetical protein